MCLIDFLQVYNSEEKCRNLLKKMRDQEGVVCKRCGSCRHYWLSTRQRYRCKDCKWETTLRSGTALHYSKMPVKYWIYAIAFLAYSKKPISSKELRGHLGHKHYRPIWAITQKLRITMGHRVAYYLLQDFIKTGVTEFPVKTAPIRTRRGGRWKIIYRGMAQVSVYSQTTDNGEPGQRSGMTKRKYVRMERTGSNGREMGFSTIRQIRESLNSVSYRDTGVQYRSELWRTEFAISKLMQEEDLVLRRNWTRLMTLNAGRNFFGVHHNISETYLNNYLNEYCYTTNRRYMQEDKLKHLLSLVVSKPWYLPLVQASDHSGEAISKNTAVQASRPLKQPQQPPPLPFNS